MRLLVYSSCSFHIAAAAAAAVSPTTVATTDVEGTPSQLMRGCEADTMSSATRDTGVFDVCERCM